MMNLERLKKAKSIDKETIKTFLESNAEYRIYKINNVGLHLVERKHEGIHLGYVLYKDIIDPLLFNQPFTPETAKEMLELYANG
jgi:hypothetical protein